MGLDCSYTSFNVPHYRSDYPSRFGRFSWYYELVSRGRALYVTDDETIFFGFSPSWTKGRNGCLQRASIVLRPEIVRGGESRLAAWVAAVAALTGKVIVKHIDEEQSLAMQKHGLRQYLEGEGWDDYAIEDDPTFPEVILETQNVSEVPEKYARNPIRDDVVNGRYALLAEESLLFHTPPTKEGYWPYSTLG